MTRLRIWHAATASAAIAAAPIVHATPVDPQRWHDLKCARYTRAWDQALVHQGKQGLGAAFLAAHAAFLASNCTQKSDVCARSPEELRLANIMVVLSMNAGTASTFPPFYCRGPISSSK